MIKNLSNLFSLNPTIKIISDIIDKLQQNLRVVIKIRNHIQQFYDNNVKPLNVTEWINNLNNFNKKLDSVGIIDENDFIPDCVKHSININYSTILSDQHYFDLTSSSSQQVFTTLVSGSSFSKMKLALTLFGFDEISKTAFYDMQNQMINEIIKFTDEQCQNNFNKLQPNSVISFDVAWDHVIGHTGWGFLRDCKTGLVIAQYTFSNPKK